jgi:uncharacterized protein YbaP (TraB family)
MEKRYKASWRKYIRGAAKHLTRIKQLMGAIKQMSEMDEGSLDGTLGILDETFQDKEQGAKLRLSNLIDILKQEGIVANARSHGPRGRGVGSD